MINTVYGIDNDLCKAETLSRMLPGGLMSTRPRQNDFSDIKDETY